MDKFDNDIYINFNTITNWINHNEPQWQVQIPKNNHALSVNYTKLSLYQRIIFRIIGWGVVDLRKKD